MAVREEQSLHAAIRAVEINEDHTYSLREGDLRELLLADDVKDLKVVVVSVAGAYRKGKSFLLDFFLRYLRAGGSDDWIGDDDTPLRGFVWKGGPERDTTGILIWNEIFKVRTPSGEELAVILMDTQGMFDSHSTTKDCTTIFALSTLLCSVQVYNLSGNIQEDDLQHLQFFTNYGALASREGGLRGSPFQKLVFLVRDWYHPTTDAYGREGGQNLLDRRLQVSEGQHPELQEVRRQIRSCFSSIEGFLLPHPGLRVASSPEFDGRKKEIEPDFIEELQKLVPSLLAPENLVEKRINGNAITCKDLLEYMRAYVTIFNGEKLPDVGSVMMRTAELNNLTAVDACVDDYKKSMWDICGDDKEYVSPSDLEERHSELKETARQKFESTLKMGNDEFCEKYQKLLDEKLDSEFQSVEERNNAKRPRMLGFLKHVADGIRPIVSALEHWAEI